MASFQAIAGVVICTYSSSPGNSWSLMGYSSLYSKIVKKRAQDLPGEIDTKPTSKETTRYKNEAGFLSAMNEFVTEC